MAEWIVYGALASVDWGTNSESTIEATRIAATVPRATAVLEELSKRFGGGVVLGAGTVLDAETARAVDAPCAMTTVPPIPSSAAPP